MHREQSDGRNISESDSASRGEQSSFDSHISLPIIQRGLDAERSTTKITYDIVNGF